MASLKTVSDELIDRFKGFAAEVIAAEQELIIIRLNASTLFRSLDRPFCMIVVDTAGVEAKLMTDPRLIDRHMVNCLEYFRLVPIVLTSDSVSAKVAIRKCWLTNGQPMVSAAKLTGRGDPKELLRDALIATADASLLSPYQNASHTSGQMFFGRANELLRIHRGRGHFIIYGDRRIGKTSLVLRLKEELREGSKHLPPMVVDKRTIEKCVYLDVSNLGKTASANLYEAILQEMQLDPAHYLKYGRKIKFGFEKKKVETYTYGDAADALSKIISHFPGQMVFILDEVDGWMHNEAISNWPEIERLRAMTDQGKAKVVLVGYESLKAATSDDKFPLYERGETMALGPLDHENIKALLIEPMSEFNIKLEPEGQILDKIWKETSGLPHLVQDVANYLLELCLSEKSESRARGRRIISLNMAKTAIHQSHKIRLFKKRALELDFPLAQAIVVVLAVMYIDRGDHSYEGNLEISNGEIIDGLTTMGFAYDKREFELALSHLEIRSILSSHNDTRTKWAWVNQSQRKQTIEVIRHNKTTNNWKELYLNLLQKHKAGSWKKSYRVLNR